MANQWRSFPQPQQQPQDPGDTFADESDLDAAAAEMEADLNAGTLPAFEGDTGADQDSPPGAGSAPAADAGDDAPATAPTAPEAPAAPTASDEPAAAGGGTPHAPGVNPLAALFGVPQFAGMSDEQVAQQVGRWRDSVLEFQQSFPEIRQQLQRLHAMESDPRFIEWQRSLAMGQQQPQQPAAPQYNPALEAHYRTVDANGQPAWRPDTPAHVMQAAAQREVQEREFAQQLLRDPGAAIQPHVNPLVQSEVNRQLNEYHQYQQRVEQERYIQAWTHQNRDWLYELDPHGQPLRDLVTGGFKMSPLGREMYQVAQELQNQRDPLTHLRLAQDIVWARRMYAQQQPRPQNAAAQAPAGPGAGGGGNAPARPAPAPPSPAARRRPRPPPRPTAGSSTPAARPRGTLAPRAQQRAWPAIRGNPRH